MKNKLILAGLIGPFLFFLILFILGLFFPGYSIQENYISELGANDSPVKTLANVLGFNLFGILIILFAIGVYKHQEINSLGKIASIFFLLAGISMFLVGIFSCDAQCENFSPTGDLHEKASNYQIPLLAIGIVLFAFSVATNEKLRILTPILLVLGIITLILAYFSTVAHIEYQNPGILQRSFIGLAYLMIAIIAYKLYKN